MSCSTSRAWAGVTTVSKTAPNCFLSLTVPWSRAPRPSSNPQIMAYPFQTETSIADWHYQSGQRYMDARSVIRSLMQNVSRNGTMLLNLTQHGRGDLDPQVIRICKDVGAWLKVNGEAVYASRPFEVFGEEFSLLHAQPRQCLCRAPGLARRPNHSQSPARRRGDPGQSVQSRTARLRYCADVSSR